MAGQKLIENLATLTGLPYDSVNRELVRLVSASGKDPKTVTMDETRAILADYLQDVLTEAKREFEINFTE